MAWIHQPEGQRFFLSGEWLDMVCPITCSDSFMLCEALYSTQGNIMKSGSLSFIGLAFRTKLLNSALDDIIRGRDLAVANSRLCELRQISQQSSSYREEWWSLLLSAVCAWRQSDRAAARSALVQAEQLEFHKVERHHSLASSPKLRRTRFKMESTQLFGLNKHS